MLADDDPRHEVPATEVAEMFGKSLWEIMPALQAGDIPARISGHNIEVPASYLRAVASGDASLPHYWPDHPHSTVGQVAEVEESAPSMSDSAEAKK